MKNYIRSGKLCGEKIKYENRIGCYIWYLKDNADGYYGRLYFPFEDFYFSFEDIDDFINLLEALKHSHSFADKFEED